MTHPTLQLLVEEPIPGSFVWTLAATENGKPVRVARRAEDGYDSYEAALAAGTHALNAQMRAQTAPAPA